MCRVGQMGRVDPVEQVADKKELYSKKDQKSWN